jgi:hypothetical protein
MLSENQFNNIKNIFTLFTNISDIANTWIQELKISDEVDSVKEKLTIIMNLITNDIQIYEGNIDEIIIIVEESLREYILEKFARESDEDTDTESDEESKFEQ